MRPDRRPFLVVSASGRALAAMARRAGARTIVLDLFADADTAGCCEAVQCVTSDRALRFHAQRLLDAAAAMAAPSACAGLIFGSGLEGRAALLARLARGRRLFGNAPETVAYVKEPRTLVALLDSMGIQTPATRFDPPSDPRGWLVKHAGGAGGVHVRRARVGSQARPGRYFQRYVPGRVLSLLFVADGRRARPIGISEQWPAGADCPRRLFSFGGAISDASIPAAVRAQVEDWGAQLAARVGLVGLNGIDFILDEADRPHCLEINPRPTATAELYDTRAEDGLFTWHLNGCDGRLPSGRIEADAVRGQAVVYAPVPLTLPLALRLPAWVGDRPTPGSPFATGAPVCTVHAAAASVAEVRKLLNERSRIIRRDVMPLAA
jgi:predicted ATP-grasp superfamily ATP-dependent carboligase